MAAPCAIRHVRVSNMYSVMSYRLFDKYALQLQIQVCCHSKLRKCLLSRKICTTSKIYSWHRINRVSKPKELVTNHDVTWDPKCNQLMEDLSNASSKTKKLTHPGSMSPREKIRLPKQVVDATLLLSAEYQKNMTSDAHKLVNYLHTRQIPVELEDRRQAEELVKQQLMQTAEFHHVLREDGLGETSDQLEKEDSERKLNKSIMKLERKARKLLNRSTYHWKPVNYDAYKSMLYLLGRFGTNYSSLYQIFYEIRKRNKEFQPRTLFDFGSGTSSTVWAANAIWQNSINEHYCVDQSDSMNTLARLLLQGGDEDRPMLFNGVFFKQFLPPSSQRKYDIVVSGFSLLDLPNRAERLNTLLNLWLKTNQFLVITELGTNEGWKLILEARDFILQLNEMRDEIGIQKRIDPEDLRGHVFAPCPHEKTCPRLERRDGTPCNFRAEYEHLTSCLREVNNEKDQYSSIRYSYVVLRKGEKSSEDVAASWPRVLRDVKLRSKLASCHTCSVAGELEFTAITKKKHGIELFNMARKPLKWGDLLPVKSYQWKNAESIYEMNESGTKENVYADTESKAADELQTESDNLKIDNTNCDVTETPIHRADAIKNAVIVEER